jgi:hypothetical protein
MRARYPDRGGCQWFFGIHIKGGTKRSPLSAGARRRRRFAAPFALGVRSFSPFREKAPSKPLGSPLRRALGLLLIFERKRHLLAAFGGFPPAGEVIPSGRSAPAESDSCPGRSTSKSVALWRIKGTVADTKKNPPHCKPCHHWIVALWRIQRGESQEIVPVTLPATRTPALPVTYLQRYPYNAGA